MNEAILFYTIGRFRASSKRPMCFSLLWGILEANAQERLFEQGTAQSNVCEQITHLSENIHESTIPAWWTRRDDL